MVAQVMVITIQPEEPEVVAVEAIAVELTQVLQDPQTLEAEEEAAVVTLLVHQAAQVL